MYWKFAFRGSEWHCMYFMHCWLMTVNSAFEFASVFCPNERKAAWFFYLTCAIITESLTVKSEANWRDKHELISRQKAAHPVGVFHFFLQGRNICKTKPLHHRTNQLTPCSKVPIRKVTFHSQSWNSQHFIQPEISLPLSQQPANCFCLEPDQSTRRNPKLGKLHFNIILSSTPKFFRVVPFHPLSHQTSLLHTCNIPCQSLQHITPTWKTWVQICPAKMTKYCQSCRGKAL